MLGCSGMADLVDEVSAELGVPVLDGVGAAVKLVEALVSLGLGTSKAGGFASPIDKPYSGPLAAFRPGSRAGANDPASSSRRTTS